MLAAVAAELSKVVADPSRVLTAPAVLDRLSHDFYWYSPVLRPLLVDKIAEVAVQPISVDEVIARIEEVEAGQVQAMAQRLFDPERIAVTLLGRLNGVKLKREGLKC